MTPSRFVFSLLSLLFLLFKHQHIGRREHVDLPCLKTSIFERRSITLIMKEFQRELCMLVAQVMDVRLHSNNLSISSPFLPYLHYCSPLSPPPSLPPSLLLPLSLHILFCLLYSNICFSCSWLFWIIQKPGSFNKGRITERHYPQDSRVCSILNSARIKGISRHSQRRTWICCEVLHRRRKLRYGWQQHPGVLHSRRYQVPGSHPCWKARAAQWDASSSNCAW